ncbi:general secretion pathway protein GspK [Wenzhouxiangella limi]|uniref:Type II secretion system protein K n=1 Tax=Wenzhouxiangella limi TaxID=2707351 RepID=A0A845UWJ1_9GAMM|nr:type II secretion system protein GspK [Wenzhouxiangella limi]NDY94968.1 general secretion pathway protein GspK [Wenzhouxiangella limi]
MRKFSQTHSQGIALIVVLWVLTLLTIVVGVYAVLARTEGLQARYLFDTTAARYAAEAGVHRAVFELRNPDMETRWVADGRPYGLTFGEAEIEIRVADETGRVDLNNAEEEFLAELFMAQGVEEQEAIFMAAAIADWRDTDDLMRVYGAEIDEYVAAGYPYGPANEPFGTVEELQQVIGMTYPLFQQVEPLLTVDGGGEVNPAFAPVEVLALLPDMDRELAELFVEEREMAHPADVNALMMPNGQMVSLRSRGRAYRIRSRAELDNGAWTVIEATVALGNTTRGRPFRVLRWQEQVEE